jgi:hypothetical protein
MQMWVHNNQRGYLDINRGTSVMRGWEEKLRESYNMCRVTCLI